MTHPAKFSAPIMELVREILWAEWPSWPNRPHIFDPFGGDGTALHSMCHTQEPWPYSGCEIEKSFIEAPGIIHGDALDPLVYPPARFPAEVSQAGWLIVTSPPYPNGISDHHAAQDGSRRYTYRSAIAEIEGEDRELHPNNAGRYSYRGTKRPEDGGTSKKREAYWDIHRRMLPHWETAEMVILNVSDFKHSNGRVEPVVKDWSDLLHEFGWSKQIQHPVGTQRMKHGENADQRVAHEVVIVARR